MARDDMARFTGLKRSNPNRANRNTHVNERKYRKLRAAKTVLVDLPDDVEERKQEKMTPDELRKSMLRKGINPYKETAPRRWEEHHITFQSFYATIDPFVPTEKGLIPTSLEEAKKLPQTGWERIKHQYIHNWWNGSRQIKSKAGYNDFDVKKFPRQAESIYISAHEALKSRDKATLHRYITELAFAKLWPDVEKGSVVWELVKFNKPSKVVSVRCSDHPYGSGNTIAQIIVKMHSTQKLAIFDRFGHLLLGSETEPKECVEFAVFENHIADLDGAWRLHDKVYPSNTPPKQAIARPELLEGLSPKERPNKPTKLALRIDERTEEERKKYERKERNEGTKSAPPEQS